MRRMKKIPLVQAGILTISLFLVGCSLNGNSGDEEEGNNNKDTTITSILTNLGVDVDLGDRGDPNGNTLSESYNPLKGTNTTLLKRCEIYQAGVPYNNKYNGLYDDEDYDLLTTQQTDGNWSKSCPKKSVGADIDGDGYEEVVTVVYYMESNNIRIRELDYQDSKKSVQQKEIDADDYNLDLSNALSGYTGTMYNSSSTYDFLNSTRDDAFFRQDLAAGDLDGDGKDEIVVTVGRMIFVLDDDYNLLAAETINNISETTDTHLRVDTADFDLDGKDEIILVNGEDKVDITAQYTIYDDILSSELASDDLSATSNEGTYALRAADVVTGDFDGDGLPEAAFCGMRSSSGKLVTLVLDTEMDNSSNPEFSFLSTHPTHSSSYSAGLYKFSFLFPGMAAGDIDGEINSSGLTTDEIVAGREVYQLDGTSLETPWGTRAARPSLSTLFADQICVGDINNDSKADIVSICYYSNDDDITNSHIYARVTNEEDSDLSTLILSDKFSHPFSTYPCLCLPNVDNDSMVVQYLEHELLFTDPIIVAALASPPYYSGINEDGEGHTYFGYLSGSSSTQASGQSFSTGMSVGFEVEDPLGTSGISAGTTVTSSMNWGTASTHEQEETWGYSIGIGEDKVVFTTIPFDVYYYEVLSAPNASDVGQIMTVNVPRSLKTYNVERTFYNEKNGDGYDISDSVLVHTLGNPDTYYSSDDINNLDDDGGLFSSNTLTVGMSSSGTTVLSMTESDMTTTSSDYELSVEVEAEVKAGYATIGTSTEYTQSYSYENSVTTGTSVEGEVPDVPTAYKDTDHTFDWGLMAYPVEDGDQAYTVVTYYVD